MTQQKIYTYLGTNGTITSPVYLPGIYSIEKINLMIYSIEKINLIADDKKVLTDGKKKVGSIIVLPEEVSRWTEIDN